MFSFGVIAGFGGLIVPFLLPPSIDLHSADLYPKLILLIVTLMGTGFVIMERAARQTVFELRQEIATVKTTINEIKGYTKGSRLIHGIKKITDESLEIQTNPNVTLVKAIWCINYVPDTIKNYLKESVELIQKRKDERKEFKVLRLFNVHHVQRKRTMLEHLSDPLTIQMIKEERYIVGKTKHTGFEVIVTNSPHSALILHSSGEEGLVGDVAHFIDDDTAVTAWDSWFASIAVKDSHLQFEENENPIESIKKFLEITKDVKST